MSTTDQFEWTTHAEAFARVTEFVQSFLQRNSFAATLAQRMRDETGTRLIDWIDRIGCEDPIPFGDVGYEATTIGAEPVMRHPLAMLPTVFETPQDTLAIHVDSVARFLLAHGLDSRIEIVGEPRGDVRRAMVCAENGTEFVVVERHGSLAWNPGPTGSRQALNKHCEQFLLRRRDFEIGKAHV